MYREAILMNEIATSKCIATKQSTRNKLQPYGE